MPEHVRLAVSVEVAEGEVVESETGCIDLLPSAGPAPGEPPHAAVRSALSAYHRVSAQSPQARVQLRSMRSR
jgi:hypothetical protein